MKTKHFLRLAALTTAAILLLSICPGRAGEHEFRTDINPGLLYFQAYQNMPQLNDADTKHLFEDWSGGAWPDQPFDERALALIRQYDNSFKLLHRARFSEVPCNWGYDLSDGPEALLPGLAPAKRLAQVARFRAMVALDAGDFERFRDDVAAAYALGRNVSKDRVLISALVQIAIENILTSIIMENYHRLSADQLDQVIAAIDSAPARGTISETIPTEHDGFYGYILEKVRVMESASGGDSSQFWTRFASFWHHIATEPDSATGPEPGVDLVRQVAGGESAGVIRLLNELPAFYAETGRIMSLAYPGYKEQFPAYAARIEGSGNPFVKPLFSIFKKVRGKEFSAMVRHEMVRAAAAYKRGGLAGLRSVEDPLTGGPFDFDRVQFEGVDRGFRLTSKEQFREFDEVMIFLEKPGKHFRLDGRNAGTSR